MADDQQQLLDLLNSLLSSTQGGGGATPTGRIYPPPILASKPLPTPFQVSQLSPSLLYLREEEIIEVTGWSQLPSNGFEVVGTLVMMDGSLSQFLVDLNTFADTEVVKLFDPLECYVLGMTVVAKTKNEDPENFLGVRIRTIVQAKPRNRPQQQLLEGLLTGTRSLSYPAGSSGTQNNGQELFKSIVVPNPPVATQALFSIALGFEMHVHSISFSYVADATVGNRFLLVQATHGGIQSYIARSTAAQTAGTNIRYNFAVYGAPEFSVGSDRMVPLPADMIIEAGDNISIRAGTFQAGDQITNISINGHVTLSY